MTILLRVEVLGILDPVGEILLGHPILGMVMRKVVVGTVAELAGPLVVGVLEVVGNFAEAALLNLSDGSVDCTDPGVGLGG